MKKYFITEIICIVLTGIFILSSVSAKKTTNKTAEEITDELTVLFGDESLVARDSGFIRETFGIDTSAFLSVSYYSSDDIMNVNEIFVGVTDAPLSAEVRSAFISYAEDKHSLFDGYAPEQAAYLDAYVLEENSGAVIFLVSEKADLIKTGFMSALG